MKTKKLIISACLSAGLIQAAFAQGADAVLSSSSDAPGSYVAGIWVDPDGCQHWVMDLGLEGMMDSVMTRDGLPVCGGGVTQQRQVSGPAVARSNTSSCGSISGDVSFASGSASLSSEGYQQAQALAQQLSSSGVSSVTVIGYTDSQGSSSANQSLSDARAQTVANAIGQSGLSVSSAYGLGEENPIADNSTASGRAANRRVELLCQ